MPCSGMYRHIHIHKPVCCRVDVLCHHKPQICKAYLLWLLVVFHNDPNEAGNEPNEIDRPYNVIKHTLGIGFAKQSVESCEERNL